MGMIMSLMGKGGLTQMLHLDAGTLYSRLIGKDIKDFYDFHIAILDIFNTLNSALPGKHYDAPSHKEVEACFETWKNAKDPRTKKKVFIEFMMERVNLSKLDDAMMITGIVTPPAAMAAKRAGEKVPQLKVIKAIPDVLFVPTVTVLALVTVKFSKRLLMGNTAS
ncbi:hypothetical protein FH972_011083 [Carpinus fangiana]|uniref:Calcium ion-binding protein n=1 Tax=Carpinus fangiana TaxID=176857 RepID=A0A660KX72_9ROSI|nr:hypothetical protein FH972_011083 [Carpinus fangiana]